MELSGSIEVDLPATAAFEWWSRFEGYPRFVGEVTAVRRLDEWTARWRVSNGESMHREWTGRVTEWSPDRAIAWSGYGAPEQVARILVEATGGHRSRVSLSLRSEGSMIPELAREAAGIVRRTVRADLERFKAAAEGSADG